MPRILNCEGLESLSLQAKARLAARESRIQIKVHLGTCGISSGANAIVDAVTKGVARLGTDTVIVSKAACIGLCAREPILTVIEPSGRKSIYADVSPAMVDRILTEHIGNGRPVIEWLLDQKSAIFQSQTIRIMHNQDLDPRNIDEYFARDGYRALAKALTTMTPEQVIDDVRKAGLRGRGGAGFPAANKWEMVRRAVGIEKFVVCNGDEGDPGAYMNRSVLEGNPHSIIEGMAIGAYAIGNVTRGYAYIRAEYPLAIETLALAISQAKEHGLLGKNILGTSFEFNLDIFPGAGAFVCGEETALLASIEGKRGNPRQRPPFPANKGLLDKPTTLNNVETWSNVPPLIWNGPAWFAGVGSEKSKGTKTFCLVGKVKDSGLIEVPLGTPMGEIVFGIGGGVPNGKKFKAVQIGGPSGGVIPAEYLNTPVDYEAVTSLGAIMGSGGLIVMDEDNCMVDMAKFFLQFTRDESCGKCTPCRAGVPKMLDLLTKISQGKGTMEDLTLIQELGDTMTAASLCSLGQTAANPALSMIRHFRQEYEAHIIDKKCPAAICQSLFRAPCQHTCPVELDVPGYVALIKAGLFEQSYRLIKQRLPFPSICGRVCHHPCEAKCRRAQIDDPVAIRHLKRAAADYAHAHGIDALPRVRPAKSERVAVIGAGPAGLSAAWDMAVSGYPVTIFEALPVAGGMLAVGIPEYRLPKAILEEEVESVRRLGVTIKLNTLIDDFPALMRDGFKAVFLAVGAHQGDKMGLPGEDLSGVYDSTDFLRQANLGKPVAIGQKVAIIGGGNSAMDAARMAVRKGAAEVHIFYRREQGDMPALPEEIHAAQVEGIQIHPMTLPTRIIARDGKASGIEYVRLVGKEFDRSGRRTPYPIPGTETIVDFDTIIEAIGQRPETSFIKTENIVIGRTGTIITDQRTLATGVPGVFAGGDAVTGPQTVTGAIAAGQRAASSVMRYLQCKDLPLKAERDSTEMIPVPAIPTSEEETKERARIKIRELLSAGRGGSFAEVEEPYTLEEARAEATRCLRCDLQGE